ncbi:hypothetical protein [Homoserinimonas hongtaonis]|uniref:Uncharacterized protein n=1 Tax=Homoserinimonas hongtaonis TaxID=2079791 RepID=A0A2U1SWH4_9MICO|nr:hypothetical protein [Salinibacterium hongtaonis]PWB95974.1 hypothetical protein DF220_11235 [Salinibacterium hongtaonis]
MTDMEQLMRTGAQPARRASSTPPTLRFRLIGRWSQLDLRSEDAAAASIRRYVQNLLGSADAEAQARALLRRSLHEGVGMAREASAVSMFLAREIAPGTAMPVTLTVYSPSNLTMSPSIGTAPATVADQLQKGLTTLAVAGIDTATRLEIEGSHILRVHHERQDPVHEATPDVPMRKLMVDYWYTVPGSKQVVLVNFMTPLVDLRDVMLEFFDSIVGASRFDGA